MFNVCLYHRYGDVFEIFMWWYVVTVYMYLDLYVLYVLYVFFI